MSRVLLIAPATSYRIGDYLRAARRLGLSVTLACDRALPLGDLDPEAALQVSLHPVNEGLTQILAHFGERPPEAVVGTDDETVELAAVAARAFGIRHASPRSVRGARDKLRFRQCLAGAGLPGPAFRRIDLTASPPAATAPAVVAAAIEYPAVLKPLSLGASRGVMRVDDGAALVAACARLRGILEAEPGPLPHRQRRLALVEAFLPGEEVALDALRSPEGLQPLVLFDKPEPLDGPYFEETLFVTPSRHSPRVQGRILEQVRLAACALGLDHGPLHAELRIHRGAATVLELAPRSIGGLCARSLRFATGASEEALILRQALGRATHNLSPAAGAHGVLMLPVPGDGEIVGIHGADEARAVPGIDAVTLTVTPGQTLRRLPEGGVYPGFVFARADTREAVERSLRRAQACLRIEMAAPDGARRLSRPPTPAGPGSRGRPPAP